MAKKNKKMDYIYTIGRRKSATARVRLYKGKKENLVNEKVIGKYFPGLVSAALWQKPFRLTKTLGKYFVTARVAGGGKDGQLEAVMHGISRALSTLGQENRTSLKKEGLLTRDSRERERRMVGTGGRARKQKQSPKR